MKSQDNSQSRRTFLKKSLIAGSLFPVTYGNLSSLFHTIPADRLKIHIFSKHLQFLQGQELAKTAAELGFDAVDLTVRKGGHVEPATVAHDLPPLVTAIRKQGLDARLTYWCPECQPG